MFPNTHKYTYIIHGQPLNSYYFILPLIAFKKITVHVLSFERQLRGNLLILHIRSSAPQNGTIFTKYKKTFLLHLETESTAGQAHRPDA